MILLATLSIIPMTLIATVAFYATHQIVKKK